MKSCRFYLLTLGFFVHLTIAVQAQKVDGLEDRAYLVEVMTKIAKPVLSALAEDRLRDSLVVDAPADQLEFKKNFSNLEIFGRLMAGMAPWLELGPGKSEEGLLRAEYIRLSVKSLAIIVEPKSKDYGNFNQVSTEPLVHTAFLAHALLRAPEQLWGNSSPETKANIIRALKSSRELTPYHNNWLLFSAIVEAALLKFSGEADYLRIDYAIKQHMAWYTGDGHYKDGPYFHMDYYNSYVIHPMLLDILLALKQAEANPEIKKKQELLHVGSNYELALRRAQRYASLQERMISPEGTFPPIGRSLTYRFGAFQALSQMALWEQLPPAVQPAQVRSALTAVVRKTMEPENTFTKEGWLSIGFYGHQPELGEFYISTSSVYLCTVGLLCLGLPPENEFWNSPAMDWTAKKAWSGQKVGIDKAQK